MNTNQTAAFKNLEQAQQALKSGDRNTARQFAAQAAQLAPELEEVWLMMGALASPRGSVEYLERALKINPQSARAQKGLQWAQARLQKELDATIPSAAATQSPAVAAQAVVEEKTPAPVIPAYQEPKTKPRAISAPAPAPVSEPVPPDQAVTAVHPVAGPKTIQSSKGAARPRSSYLALLVVILLCLVAIWAAWKGVTPAAAFLNGSVFASAEHGPAWAKVNLARADAAQSAADVIPATAEALAGPELVTATNAPENLDTAAPTSTPTPGEIANLPAPTNTLPAPPNTLPAPTYTNPAPVNTDLPTLTPEPSATQQMASVEEASPTPLPTDTAAPQATQYIPATPLPGVADAGGSGHWIDVDLTHQMVYAYDGNTLVNSFLVSTGTWEHPTVTGQYRVYVKYRYADMSGPGYYLPNVPFTMYFYKGYALHGTYWHSNFGTPMSHGCVNFSIPDSEWVYNFSSVGTLVNVHY